MTDGAAVIVSFLLLIPTTQANCVPSAGGAIDPIVGLHRLRGEDEVVTSCVGISWWSGSDDGVTRPIPGSLLLEATGNVETEHPRQEQDRFAHAGPVRPR